MKNRLVILGPGHPRLGTGTAPGTALGQALMTAARAREGWEVLALWAAPPGLGGLRLPPGAVFTGLAGTDETLMTVPDFDAGLRLCRSWYVVEKLREFLTAANPHALIAVDGVPVPLEALALMRRAHADTRLAWVFPAPGLAPGPAAPPAPEGEAGALAALIFAEMAREARLLHLGPAAPPRARHAARRPEPVADAAQCVERMLAIRPEQEDACRRKKSF